MHSIMFSTPQAKHPNPKVTLTTKCNDPNNPKICSYDNSDNLLFVTDFLWIQIQAKRERDNKNKNENENETFSDPAEEALNRRGRNLLNTANETLLNAYLDCDADQIELVDQVK